MYYKNWVGVVLAFLFYEQKLATPISCLDESGLSLQASIQTGLQSGNSSYWKNLEKYSKGF